MNPDFDRDLARLYRSAAREEPPAWLDDRVLAAARAQVLSETKSKAGKRFRLVRWQLPLALAAVVTLAISLALVMEGELEAPGSYVPMVAPAMRPPAAAQSAEPRMPSADVFAAREAPAREPEPSTRALPLPAMPPEVPQHTGESQSLSVQPSAPGLPAQAERTEPKARQQQENARVGEVPAAASPVPSYPAAPPGATAPSVSPAPRAAEPAATAEPREAEKDARASKATERAATIPDAQSNVAKRERSRADTREAPVPGRAAPTRGEALGGMAADSEAVAQAQGEAGAAAKSAQQWLREIEQLRHEGHLDEARVRLEAFKKRFPNHAVPASLQ